jgi:wee1-like protein kinase
LQEEDAFVRDLFGDGDPNEGRFRREFHEATLIGQGEFSKVYRARNIVDQQIYAVKVQTPTDEMRSCLRGFSGASWAPASAASSAALREARTLARIASAAPAGVHLLRYFSSWLEDGRLHIQTELCEASLRDLLDRRQKTSPQDPRWQAVDLAPVLRQVGEGLAVLHHIGLAHLDIKPDNVLVGQDGHYKIADLGLAVNARDREDINEGDCRYLAKEVLCGDISDLPRADVFSLGLVCYELATSPRPLPRNGEDWQCLREGSINEVLMPLLPELLLKLLRAMLDPVPAGRPSSQEVASHPGVAPAVSQDDKLEEDPDQLRAALRVALQEAERSKQEVMLMKKLLGERHAWQDLVSSAPLGG